MSGAKLNGSPDEPPEDDYDAPPPKLSKGLGSLVDVEDDLELTETTDIGEFVPMVAAERRVGNRRGGDRNDRAWQRF